MRFLIAYPALPRRPGATLLSKIIAHGLRGVIDLPVSYSCAAVPIKPQYSAVRFPNWVFQCPALLAEIHYASALPSPVRAVSPVGLDILTRGLFIGRPCDRAPKDSARLFTMPGQCLAINRDVDYASGPRHCRSAPGRKSGTTPICQ